MCVCVLLSLLLFLVCSSRKYPYPLPPTAGKGNFEGGDPKIGNFQGAGELRTEVFARGSK